MATTCMMIIDVQKGFINQWTEHIPEIVETLQNRYDLVFVSRFFNPEGSLQRKLIGWERFAPGSEDVDLAFTAKDGAYVFDKSTYTCLTDDILARLQGSAVGEVHLCGIATDNCVLKTAVDLFEAGIIPTVLAAACASHGGIEAHEAGLMLLKRFIGEAQVVTG